MAVAPSSSEIFHRAADEGERRLDQSLLELASTSFTAGFTIIFGIVGLGIAHSVVEPRFGEIARPAGAPAFGPGLVFLVVGRAELFTENSFDPVARLVERREAGVLPRLLRLWSITLLLNLVGGVLLALTVAVPDVVPEGTREALRGVAEEIAARLAWPGFVSAIIGGALVALLSFLLQAVSGVGSRMALAYMVGVLLAVGPFDHVVVTALHLLLAMFLGAPVTAGDLTLATVIATSGNLVGGVGLVTLSHVAQARGARESSG